MRSKANVILFTGFHQYDIECIRVKNNGELCYVFYFVGKKEDTHSAFIKVYKVSNPVLFTRNAHEIIWNLQKKTFMNVESPKEAGEELFYRIQNKKLFCLECPDYFFSGNINHPLYFGKPMNFLMLNRTKKNVEIPSFLYSEMLPNSSNMPDHISALVNL